MQKCTEDVLAMKNSCFICNSRTTSISGGLADAMWLAALLSHYVGLNDRRRVLGEAINGGLRVRPWC